MSQNIENRWLQAMMDTNRKIAFTANGAKSEATTTSARLDLYTRAIRGISKQDLFLLLDKSFEEDSTDTFRIMFNKRDCRGGAGERQVFYWFLDWCLDREYTMQLLKVLPLIKEYGRWGDLLHLMCTSLEHVVLDLFANQLLDDYNAMMENKNVSLAAKWVPTEGSSIDRKTGFVSKISQFNCIGSRRRYRKRFITPLRKYIDVTERKMCGNDWENINYEKVASYCMLRNRKAFAKHDSHGFDEYMNKLKSGQAKINSAVLFAHDIVKAYFKTNSNQDLQLLQVDDVLEAQWDDLVKKTKEMGVLSDWLVVCDVSGSMYSGFTIEPIYVSLALGLLISSVSEGCFKNQIITFSEKPEFHVVEGDTLLQRIISLKGANWGYSTDLQATFNMILHQAQKFNLGLDEMPQKLLILSDMQFDSACGRNDRTNYEAMVSKFKSAGYVIPQTIFWNLNGKTSNFPVVSTETNTAILSGFNVNVLKAIIEKGNIPSPYEVLRHIIDAERYKDVVCLNTLPKTFQVIIDDTNHKKLVLKLEENVKLLDLRENGLVYMLDGNIILCGFVDNVITDLETNKEYLYIKKINNKYFTEKTGTVMIL